MTVDGIKLPERRGVANPGELLAPAGVSEEREEGDMGLRKEGRVCGLCLSKPPSYTCPRCNVPYCGLACYRSSAHSICSEEFYKESVIQELRVVGETEEEGKRRMQEILLRLSKEGERKGGIGEMFQEMEEGKEDRALANGDALSLLSRLAEIQSSGVGEGSEIEDILTKLKEIGEKEGDRGQIDETVASHRDIDELEEQDLAEQFSGLDIESLSEEQVWALLPQQDKDRFEGLVKRGAIGGLLPLWRPWWESHEGGQGALIELLEGESDGEEQMVNLKEVEGNIEEREGWTRSEQVVKSEREEKGEKGSLRVRDRKRVRVVEGERGHTHDKGEKRKLGRDRTDSDIVAYGNEEDGSRGGGGKGTGPCEKETPPQMRQGHQKRMAGSKRKSSSSMVPQVNKKIPPLNALSSQASPLVRYSVVNVLYGYSVSLSLFNGDLSEPDLIQEFCQVVLAMSESLSSNRVFSSFQEALEAGTRSAKESGCFDPGDPGAQARAVEGVAHIMAGKSKQDKVGYTLAALSQLQAVLNQARGALPKEGEGRETRRKYFLAGKKCEFLQSWVKDNGPVMRLLAGRVWREHMKMENERKCLDEQKKVVEESWKKGRGRGKGKLIEEIEQC
ncbi:hypothetical protein SKAU_G00267540 [Synaphobranchus kaupii]|uniref:HIT-type domain-containing protein n=1 Tax=Synaphobranchus kaupii TaxID=118154 RepID=A0A9Q1IPC1_SYNKA|nr:hypothetical protein SKAU_G00267540 [Synaphobranchus kaupii]